MEHINWTEEQSLKLIDEYHQRPVLWDKKDLMYKAFYEEAWLDIGNIMGIDHNSCIKHMSLLMAQLQLEKSRLFADSGAKTDWFAWNALAFLHFADYEKLRLITGNYVYNEKLGKEKKRIQELYVAKDKNKSVNESDVQFIEDLDEDIKALVKDLATKMKNYPIALRENIKDMINDVLKLADSEHNTAIEIIDD